MTEDLKHIDVSETIKSRIRNNQDPVGLIDRMCVMIESSGFNEETKKRLVNSFEVLFISAFSETESPASPIVTQEPLTPPNNNGHSQEPLSKRAVIFQEGLNGLSPEERGIFLNRRKQRRIGHDSEKDGRPRVKNPLRKV